MLLVHEIYESLAVIITCHRYEHFLPEALDSVLSQEITPTEIIVVDDCPELDGMTPYHPTKCERILNKYPQVRRIETEYGDPLLARKAGFEESTSEYIIFLDADDKLGEGYIERAIQLLSTTDVIYSDLQYFGNGDDRTDFPETIAPGRVSIGNFLHVGCAVKRKAIEISHAFEHPDLSDYHEDWFFWRKLLNMGFTIRKQENLYYARRHGGNRSNALHSEELHTNAGHYQTRGTAGDSITFVGFGDTDTPLILNQNWPAKQSHCNVYGTGIPRWLDQLSCGYTYRPEFWDELDIINHTLRTNTTDWIFFYKEGIGLHPGICEEMLKKAGPASAIHNTDFEFLECTLIVAPIVRHKPIISKEHLQSLVQFKLKYV